MTDPSRYPDSEPDTTRRWVRVVVIVVVIVVLVVVVMLLIGGGHRPRRHTAGGDAVQQVRSQAVHADPEPEAEGSTPWEMRSRSATPSRRIR
jgi:hypothetical protein